MQDSHGVEWVVHTFGAVEADEGIVPGRMILGLAGGTLGYVLGTLAAMVLGPQLAGLKISPIPIYLLWSLIVASTIALVGSWYPVYRAARLDPALIMQET